MKNVNPDINYLDKDYCYKTESQNFAQHNLYHHELEQGCYTSWFWFEFLLHIQQNTLTNLRTHSNLRQLNDPIINKDWASLNHLVETSKEKHCDLI